MTNETATTTIDAPALAAVQAASAAWIRSFNAGDTDACVAGYTEDAVMEVASVGRFEGHAAIDGFWRPFMAQGAGALVYEDVRLRMVDPSTVELSARWSMNVGGGVITCERWVEQPDGRWRLAYDAFEIQRRHDAS